MYNTRIISEIWKLVVSTSAELQCAMACRLSKAAVVTNIFHVTENENNK